MDFRFDTSLSGPLKLLQFVAKKQIYFSKTVVKYFNIPHKKYLACVCFPCFIDMLLCRLSLHIHSVSYSLRMLALMINSYQGSLDMTLKSLKLFHL